MFDIAELKEIFEKEKSQNIQDFFTFLRFKSIATDPTFHTDVMQCAKWLSEYLQQCGLQVEQWDTTGQAPVIFATDLRAGPEKETLLIYCHYDVQPVDPLNEWLSPPFEPTIRENQVYARGASDDKGQCFYTILALKALLTKYETLPVNIKFIIEGEEESGSLGLCQLLEEKKEDLKADHLLIVDSWLENPDTPAITVGARGIVCMEVSVKEGSFDLHSGMVGGMAYNPNRALAELLAKLHDEYGSVSIPGFYDEVVSMTPHEKKELSFEFEEADFESLFGFKPTGMEKEVCFQEAGLLRPTLEINGMRGGYTGPGFKTIIPAKATAKLSCRLVPNQSPHRIAKLVEDFLIRHTPSELTTEVSLLNGSGKGFRTNPHARIVTLLAQSYADVFQKPCQKILIGGSIPIAAELCATAGAEMVLVGVAHADDRVHSPNEHFGWDRFETGFLTICRAIQLFS